MYYSKEDVLVQEQIKEISEKYPSTELQIKEILRLQIKPEQVWLFFKKIRGLKTYQNVRDSDMFNLLSDFIDQTSRFTSEERSKLMDQYINNFLQTLTLTASHDYQSQLSFSTVDDTIQSLKEMCASLGLHLDDHSEDLHIERLQQQYSELEIIEEDTAKCNNAIAKANQLIVLLHERINLNEQKKETIRSNLGQQAKFQYTKK